MGNTSVWPVLSHGHRPAPSQQHTETSAPPSEPQTSSQLSRQLPVAQPTQSDIISYRPSTQDITNSIFHTLWKIVQAKKLSLVYIV